MNRQDLLQKAMEITSLDRNVTYGDFHVTHRCYTKLKQVFHQYAGKKYSVEHNACIDLALLKIARMASGSLHVDNYIDAAVYITGAYECELKKDELTDLIDDTIAKQVL